MTGCMDILNNIDFLCRLMEVWSYRTIDTPAEGLYKEKGSRFIALAYPVTSEEQIREHLERVRKKYFDARHHCFAWMLGPERKHFRAFDDGEPNHSAGDPILGQIRSKDLTDVLVIVVRYFGGTKLGVGGLITAYKTAAEDALSKVTVIEKEVEDLFQLVFPYTSTPQIMKMIKEFDLRIVNQQHADGSILDVSVPKRISEVVLERVRLLSVTGTPVGISPIEEQS